jgi:hypothetical protein
MTTWTVVRIALWGTSPTGRARAHTSVHLEGVVPEHEALERSRERITEDRIPFNIKQYLLNCLDLGNCSVSVETT